MIVAMFENEAGLVRALAELREKHIGRIDTYTPAPLQDEPTSSPIPLIILLAGLCGAAASFGLLTYSFTVAFRFPIGGRPDFAWASFIPTVFENAVLVAIAAGMVAFFAINRMPRLYDPVDELDAMRRASRDRWFVRVSNPNAAMLDAARRLLQGMNPVSIDELPE